MVYATGELGEKRMWFCYLSWSIWFHLKLHLVSFSQVCVSNGLQIGWTTSYWLQLHKLRLFIHVGFYESICKCLMQNSFVMAFALFSLYFKRAKFSSVFLFFSPFFVLSKEVNRFINYTLIRVVTIEQTHLKRNGSKSYYS